MTSSNSAIACNFHDGDDQFMIPDPAAILPRDDAKFDASAIGFQGLHEFSAVGESKPCCRLTADKAAGSCRDRDMGRVDGIPHVGS